MERFSFIPGSSFTSTPNNGFNRERLHVSAFACVSACVFVLCAVSRSIATSVWLNGCFADIVSVVGSYVPSQQPQPLMPIKIIILIILQKKLVELKCILE